MTSEDLAAILRRYHVPFDRGAVQAAFRQDEAPSELAGWAGSHLTSDTLLSVDELLQYSALEKSGRADQLAASADLTAVLSFSDQELQDAIEELNRSTETITKHAETLRQQKDSLDRLLKAEAMNAEGRSALELERAQAWDLDRRNLASAVQDLAEGIGLRISELKQHDAAQSDLLRKTLDSVFASDDRLLAGLQKLGWELETEDPDGEARENRLRDICARLIKYTVETIRTRLDRLYLESIEASNIQGLQGHADRDEVSALQEELESLYSEILPVAQMSVEEQYLGPALKSLSARNGKGRIDSARATGYINECLELLLDHIDKICLRVETFQAHRTASNRLIATAEAELSTQVEPAHRTGRRRPGEASPTRRRRSAIFRPDHSPTRTPAPPKSRRRSSGIGADADDPPLDELLRRLAIALPAGADGPGDPATLPQQQAAALARTLADRTDKAAGVARNAQEAFEAAATAQLRDSGLALQMLRDSLLAESPFGRVRLVDPEIEASLEVLDQELEKVRARLEAVDPEIAKARGRKGKREEVVRRWGW